MCARQKGGESARVRALFRFTFFASALNIRIYNIRALSISYILRAPPSSTHQRISFGPNRAHSSSSAVGIITSQNCSSKIIDQQKPPPCVLLASLCAIYYFNAERCFCVSLVNHSRRFLRLAANSPERAGWPLKSPLSCQTPDAYFSSLLFVSSARSGWP